MKILDAFFVFGIFVVLIISIVVMITYEKPDKSHFDFDIPEYHIVMEGETLSSISKKYYPDLDYRDVVDILKRTNQIEDSGRLKEGDKIILK